MVIQLLNYGSSNAVTTHLIDNLLDDHIVPQADKYLGPLY